MIVVAAFALTATMLPLLTRLAFALGWNDIPDARKAHEGAIPLSGGVTIFSAVALTLVFTGTAWPSGSTGLAMGLMLVFFTGLWDDRFPLRARYRLVAQLAGSIAVVALGDTVLQSLGRTFTPFEIGLWWFAFPMTVVALTGLVNAFNMADGLDGLCSGYVLIALVSLLTAGSLLANWFPGHSATATLIPIALPFIGSIAAFLLFNLRHPWRSKASVFLGDAGSMALGFLVGWLCLRLAGIYGPASMPPVVAVYIVVLPLADMFSCMVRRYAEGITPMSADRKHLHHLLMTKGFSVRQTVGLLHGLAALFASAGIVGWIAGVPEYLMFWALIAGFAAYTRAALRYWRAFDERALGVPASARKANGQIAPNVGIGSLGATSHSTASLSRQAGLTSLSAEDVARQRTAIDAGVSSVRR